MIRSDALIQAQRNLGLHLAQYRQAANLNQDTLASRLGYSRSTIANVETGRQNVPRDFWEHCDSILKANGLLIRYYNRFQLVLHQERAQVATRNKIAPARERSPFDFINFADSEIRSAFDPYVSELPTTAVEEVITQVVSPKLTPKIAEALEVMVRDFWKRDDQFGSEVLRPAVTAQLRFTLGLLQGYSGDEISRQRLLSVAAELARLAGWMLFDSGLYSTSRIYFKKAIQLGKATGDRSFIANVLSCMSLQLTYENSPEDALSLARMAQDISREVATSKVKAMLCMREAFAHAVMQDNSACHQAIAASEKAFSLSRTGDLDPEWISYFSETKMIADTGIALSKLGEFDSSLPLIEQALESHDPDNVRPRAFHTFWLSMSYLNVGDLDKACIAGSDALELASSIESPRVASHIHELKDMLIPWGKEPKIRHLREQIEHSLSNKQGLS